MSDKRAHIVRGPRFDAYLRALQRETVDVPVASGPEGVVRDVSGEAIRVMIAGVRIGDVVDIFGPDTDDAVPALSAEVVDIRQRIATVLPLGSTVGVSVGCRVRSRGCGLALSCSRALLGQVVDGLGVPMGGVSQSLQSLQSRQTVDRQADLWPVERPAPDPMRRPRIQTPLVTGVRAIDGLLTLGRGQRVGLFAGPGVGKSSLLGRIARASDVDVCVVCLVGERGRDVREFVDVRLDAASRARTVVVCATIDAPGLVRVRAVQVATAIAEWFRDRQGAHVLLLVDSLTRLARAQRDVGLARGDMPVWRGYPASVFTLLPRLIERAGTAERGAITAIYTVLTSTDGLSDGIADEVRSLVDGHIVLDRERANRGRWPAVDVVRSVSRVMNSVIAPEHRRAAARIKTLLAVYGERADLVSMGAYRSGTDPELDIALAAMATLERFLCHEQSVPYERCIAQLLEIADHYAG